MTFSYQNPIGPIDPYDKYRAERIGRKFSRPEGSSGNEPPEEKWAVAAYLLSLLKRGLSLLFPTKPEVQSKETEALHHLAFLKTSFELLKREDRSQDSEFLNNLSKNWHSILEDSLFFKQTPSIFSGYKALIKKIEAYPEGEPHTFGFYLSEYAGQTWIPFPYMDLIQKIHNEYEQLFENSALADWTSSIDHLTRLLYNERS